MSKYKAKWESMSKNEDFWNEVLVGRKIESLEFSEKGLIAFKLDSGERVTLVNTAKEGLATICIQDDL